MVPAVLALAALGSWVSSAGVAGWEVSLTREIRSWPDALGLVLRPAVELGNRLVALAVAITVAVRWGRRAGAVVAGSALGASVVATVLKALVERPRITPAQLGADPRHVVEGFSFPSSHVAIAFGAAVALVLVTVAGRWAPLAVGAATLTGIGRMWLGVHLPLDVVGGALVGTLCALVAVAVADRLSSRRPPPT